MRVAIHIRMLIPGALTMICALDAFGAVPLKKVDTQKVIAGYVFPQNRQLQKDEIAAGLLTRVNYAFANIEDGRIVNGFQYDDQNLAALVELKQQNPALTVMISVGGWEWSSGFSDMALTKESRNVFIASVNDYIERHELDGVDIDWEYPGQEGSSDHFRSEDKRNFTLLLQELRLSFKLEERKLHRPLYLTIAAGAAPGYLANTEMGDLQQYIDAVNLMAYDYYEPGETTGNHAPLYTDPDDPKQLSADRSVQDFERAGVPASKIVLGVPFYGHEWGAVEDAQHGLFQAGKRIPRGYAPYKVIAADMINNGFDRYWDKASSVPYLYNPQEKIFVSYEDAESLAIKSNYVMEHDLGGMMFWDYSGDPTGVLLNAIHAGLTQQAPFKPASAATKTR